MYLPAAADVRLLPVELRLPRPEKTVFDLYVRPDCTVNGRKEAGLTLTLNNWLTAFFGFQRWSRWGIHLESRTGCVLLSGPGRCSFSDTCGPSSTLKMPLGHPKHLLELCLTAGTVISTLS